jgi:hypothetical protein
MSTSKNSERDTRRWELADDHLSARLGKEESDKSQSRVKTEVGRTEIALKRRSDERKTGLYEGCFLTPY